MKGHNYRIAVEMFDMKGRSRGERAYHLTTKCKTIQAAVAQLRGLRGAGQLLSNSPVVDHVANWDGYVHVRLFDMTGLLGSWLIDFTQGGAEKVRIGS